jgi:hypothetical protein
VVAGILSRGERDVNFTLSLLDLSKFRVVALPQVVAVTGARVASAERCEGTLALLRLYQEALGRLNWLVRDTRPDIAFVVHKLSQHCQSPSVRHWNEVKRVLRYLQHTKAMRLRYGNGSNDVQRELLGYADSDYVGDSTDRKSTMGYTYLLHGGAITWSTRKQQSVATSTTEAEYMGLCNAAKEAVWLRNLLMSLGLKKYVAQNNESTRIYGDNQGSLKLVANPEMHSRSKHIDVQYHYLRELAQQGLIEVECTYCGDGSGYPDEATEEAIA